MDGTDRHDDGELVAAVLAGQREAFGPLLARWQASVLRLCRRLLGPGPQAEDVAQEAALAAFLGLPRRAQARTVTELYYPGLQGAPPGQDGRSVGSEQ